MKKDFVSKGLKFSFILFNLFSYPTQIFSQPDTVVVKDFYSSGGIEGTLNTAVQAVIDTGDLSNTVFKLQPFGYYILTDSILVPSGKRLTIIAPEPGNTQETSPPQILCSMAYDYPPYKHYLIYCNGDITLKNLWFLYANTDGEQKQVNIQIADGPGVTGEQTGIFENVIFDYSGIPANSSGAVGITTKHFNGTFRNCYFKNCTDRHFRYYGRAVSFPYNSTGNHIDSLVFENCTFTNIGYVYMQEGGEYADYVKFNHCTFLNVVMFSLESGWWNKLSVTNSIFVNTFMYGYQPINEGYELNGGTIKIDSISAFGFQVPFTEQERRILFTNSSYYIENWLRDWMYNNPASVWWRTQGEINMVPVPQPMLNPTTLNFFESDTFPYMNEVDLYDSTNPNFIFEPSDTNAIRSFLYHKWNDSVDTLWAWKSENSFNQLWPLEENLAYTNQELKAAGMGNFPLGDLYHWWPEEYGRWLAQKGNEDARISYWLNYGRDSIFTNVKKEMTIANRFELLQNYPNPFNPTTTIKYSIPKPGLITLKVYDVLGREVATLVNEEKPVGKYRINFNCEGFVSGVYFYQLRVGNFVETKKLILLK